MMVIFKRIKDATVFYKEEFVREGSKELAVWRAFGGRKPVVSYLGFTGHKNLGDEILFDAYKKLFPDFALVPFRNSRLLRAYTGLRKKSPYVGGFLGGGTLINQSTRWTDQIAVLQAQGLPIACLGTGVTETKFRAKHEKTSMSEWVHVLETFQSVGVRGPRSKQLLEEAGFKNFVVAGDTALALAPAKMPKRPNAKILGFNYGLVKENQIWGDAGSYTENIAEAIRELIAAGWEVRLLTVWDKDLPSTRALVKLVNDPRCTMRVCYQSLEKFNAELGVCDVFVGQKLHATIMACMQRIPSIMIEYQPKCRDFMASVGMEDYIIKTSDCTPERLQKLLAKLQENGSEIQKTLDTHIKKFQKIQEQQATEITKAFLDHVR